MDNLNFKNHSLYSVYSIDTAINSLLVFYKNNFAKLFAMSLIMAAILQYAMTYIDIASIQSENDINVLIEKMGEATIPLGIIVFLNLFFVVIIQHYIMFSPLDENSSIVNSITGSFKYLFPYIVTVTLLVIFGGMAITFGLVLLFIGAFFAALYVVTLFLFILPIMIVEGVDISHTIRRTFKLAHKDFWINIGWVAVFIALFLLITIIISGLILAPFAGNFLQSIFNPGETANYAEITQKPLYIVLLIIANALTMPLIPLLSAILYFNGIAKEDAGQRGNFTETEEKKITVEDLYAKPYFEDQPEKKYDN